MPTEADWNRASIAIDALVSAWEREESPPDLVQHARVALVESDPGSSLRPWLLAELVKIDMEERRGRTGTRGGAVRVKSVDGYLAEFPEISPYEEELRREDDHVGRRWLDSRPTDPLPEVSDALEGLEPGQVLDDFDLLESLGRGSFARVFLARQRSMLRLVAVKVSCGSADEPQTLAQLHHPDIVRVYDQKNLAEVGLHLLYMEVLPGGTLADVIDQAQAREQHPSRTEPRRGSTLLSIVDAALAERPGTRALHLAARAELESKSWSETTAWLGARLARALDYAHRRHVLHCDLKPANVLLTASYTPKLTDFNVSRRASSSGRTPSRAGGSIAYMSPEQLEHLDPQRDPLSLDARSDQYSLALLLCEFATLSRPFVADVDLTDPSRAVDRLLALRRCPEAIERALPDDEPELRRVLARCLSPNRDDRYPSCHALAIEFELTQDPAIRGLRQRARRGWRSLAARWPIASTIAAVVAPNLAAAIYNYCYNRTEIVGADPALAAIFHTTQLGVNAVIFPVGIILGARLLRPLARGRDRAPVELDAEPPPLATLEAREAVKLGDRLSLLSIALWLVAGFAYPIALELGGAGLEPARAAHFFGSLVTCGLVAAAYPFFAVNTLLTEAWWPRLLESPPTPANPQDLGRLARRTHVYFNLAVALPVLTVALFVGLGTQSRTTLLVLLGMSLVGLAVTSSLARRTRRNLAALGRAFRIVADRGEDSFA